MIEFIFSINKLLFSLIIIEFNVIGFYDRLILSI